MGYGQIVGGMKQTAAARRKGSGSRVMSMYRAERDAITAKAETFEAIGHAAVSLHKGYSEGQSQWANLEEGAAELGLEEQIADKRAGAGRWEKFRGPSEKTLESMVTGDEVDGKRLEISYGELKSMGEIKRTSGSKYLKTMDPITGEYKDVKDSGWGEMKDVLEGDTTEPYEKTREKDYSNFPIAESLLTKTGETLGNIQGSITDWWKNKAKKGDNMNEDNLLYNKKVPAVKPYKMSYTNPYWDTPLAEGEDNEGYPKGKTWKQVQESESNNKIKQENLNENEGIPINKGATLDTLEKGEASIIVGEEVEPEEITNTAAPIDFNQVNIPEDEQVDIVVKKYDPYWTYD